MDHKSPDVALDVDLTVLLQIKGEGDLAVLLRRRGPRLLIRIQ